MRHRPSHDPGTGAIDAAARAIDPPAPIDRPEAVQSPRRCQNSCGADGLMLVMAQSGRPPRGMRQGGACRVRAQTRAGRGQAGAGKWRGNGHVSYVLSVQQSTRHRAWMRRQPRAALAVVDAEQADTMDQSRGPTERGKHLSRTGKPLLIKLSMIQQRLFGTGLENLDRGLRLALCVKNRNWQLLPRL
jgi:hypothetical protein